MHVRFRRYATGQGAIVTSIRTIERNTAEYRRPEWMTDEQWQHVSAEMTEQWLTLLEEQARCANPAAGRTAS
jgi:hypothetical protein